MDISDVMATYFKLVPFIAIFGGLFGLVFGISEAKKIKAKQEREAALRELSSMDAQYKLRDEPGKRKPVKPLPAPSDGASHGEFYVKVLVTILVLVSALVVILMKGTYSDAEQKWAFGAVGTILGYWLKK